MVLGVAAAGSLAAAGSASATLIAYDPYNQAVGNLSGTASSGGGATWPTTANYAGSGTVAAGSLTYGPLTVAGNRDQELNGQNATRAFGSNQGGAGKDLWLSFLINGDAGSQGVSLFNSGTEQMFIGTQGTNFGALVYSGTGRATLVGTNPSVTVSPAVAPVSGVAHLMVTRLQLTTTGASTFSFWLDPAVSSLGTGSAPTGGSTASYTTGEPFAFDTLRVGAFAGTAAQFDEVRMATTWAEVSPVPGPATAGLGLAALGLLAARRRRRPSGNAAAVGQ